MISPTHDLSVLKEKINAHSTWIAPLRTSMSQRLIGQDVLVSRLLIALLTKGHVLLEGVPGLAKTLALKTLSSLIDASFQRIQFTPDMLPADILGTEIYNPQTGSFETKKGVLFSHLILADEINRAPAKVQSALLEAMQERQITLGEKTFQLPDPFLVMATQNPIEQEGTYPLPEAQVDRFMLKTIVDYPSVEEERQILDIATSTQSLPPLQPVVSLQSIAQCHGIIDAIYIDESIKNYIVALVYATRKPQSYGLELADFIAHGASPRATIALTLASRAMAFLQGRAYITPEDVKTIAYDVLTHRIMVTYEADAQSISPKDCVTRILETIPVP